MPKLLESKTFIQFFDLDPKGRTKEMSENTAAKWLLLEGNGVLESLRKWAEEHYPDAPQVYQRSFAGLMEYFGTGAYGGYGTESLRKERYAESKAYAFYRQMADKLSVEQMTEAMIWFVASHLLQKVPLEERTEDTIKEAVDLLEATKSSFKSKQVAEARKKLEGLIK